MNGLHSSPPQPQPEKPIRPDELQWTAEQREKEIKLWPTHLKQDYNEDAANYEFLANMTREDAEWRAFAEMRRRMGF
jgi:hypothetical protein